MTDSPSRRSRLFWLALIPFGLLVARFEHLIDDAFISFRYAHNWAVGNGLRFNLSDGPPVEGFSNFLWVALLALGERLGVRPEHLANVVSVACGVVLLWLFHRVASRDLRLRPTSAFLGTLFLACFPPFAVWCTGGLETAAFSLLLFAAWRELSRPESPRPLLAALLALLLAASRPEGLAWSFGLLVAAGFGAGFGREWRRRMVRYLPVTVAGVLLLLLGRWLYFGHWISNTTLAKGQITGETLLRGWKSLASYFVVLLSPLLGLALLPWARRIGQRRMVDSAALMFLAGLAFNVVVGGDWMAFFRLLAPLTPFLALLLAAGLDRLSPSVALSVGSIAVLLGLLPAFDVHLAPSGLREAIDFRSFLKGYETEYERFQTSVDNTTRYALAGRALAQIARPGDSLVTGSIGAIGYYSGVTIHDRNGLVDREVASRGATAIRSAGHDKRVPRSFFAGRHPTWYAVSFRAAAAGAGLLRGFARSVLSRAVRESPAGRALLDLCYPFSVRVKAQGEELPGGSLFVLLACDQPRHARSVWASMGVR